MILGDNQATVFYFGGYRQDNLKESSPRASTGNAFSTFVKSHAATYAHINLWRGNGDSLTTRWKRFEMSLPNGMDIPGDVYILGYSMGCHLAVRAAHALASTTNCKVVCLIAPDPKYQRNILDWYDINVSTLNSAYDEAIYFWPAGKSAGDSFTRTLNTISTTTEVTVIYANDDPIALWKDNLEITKRDCEHCEHIKWRDVRAKRVNNHGFNVDLQPAQAVDEYWVHSQLFSHLKLSRLNFERQNDG